MTLPPPVRRRHVFYVSGFDPNGPSRYHKLYSDGAGQQAAAGGPPIEVGARNRIDAHTMGWTVRQQDGPGEAGAVDTRYVFPRWDSIIRDHWWQDQAPQVVDLLRTSWLYLRTGALWKMVRQSWPVFVCLFGPFFLLLALLPGAAAGLAALAALAIAWRADAPLHGPAAAVAGIGVLALWWVYWARRHWRTQWILRGYAFVGRMADGGVPGLDSRLDAMAEALCRQAREATDDEILLVGHSLGTIMAVSVLARALRLDPELTRHGPAIGLLTLGHCVPLLSNLPAARRFRDELAALAMAPDLCWVDFSDPLDDYSFAGVDPVKAAGIRVAVVGRPQLRSPCFSLLFDAGGGRMPAMSQHEIHQQYLRPCRLRSAPAPEDFDFFAITAGPVRLAERYPATGGRAVHASGGSRRSWDLHAVGPGASVGRSDLRGRQAP